MCAKPDTTGLLADATYAVFHNEADTPVGYEYCRLYRRSDKGYWMTAELDLPFPRALYIEIRAGADWRIQSLDVRLSGRGTECDRDASHRADGDIWQATIQTDEATVERAVPFGPEMGVDFEPVWLNTLALNRLKLAPGQVRNVDAIRIELPLLEPVSARLRYKCIGPERITTPAGKWDATHYVVSGNRHVWADARGIVVATQQGKSRSRTLTEYHWLG